MKKTWLLVGGLTLGWIVAACSDDDENATVEAPGDGGGPITIRPDGGDDRPDATDRDASTEPEAGAPSPIVYFHTPTNLYKFDPSTNTASLVAPLSGGCEATTATDLAIDSASRAYMVTFGALYSVDLKTGVCTKIADGSFPNSLTFVPKGTLDPNADTLVGYSGSTYVRVNTGSGAVEIVGALGASFASSGDLVHVDGTSYLSTTGSGCADCLARVDPVTGALIASLGPLGHSSVYGLAQVAGVLHGFDTSGKVFSVVPKESSVEVADVTYPGLPTGLSFYGAASAATR